jgi:hypothetical protein
MINSLTAPLRRIVRFPLFQLLIVVLLILWLQAAADQSVPGLVFRGLDELVEATVNLVGSIFTVKSFTKAWLTSGFWIAYVYLACLIILSVLRMLTGIGLDLIARHNVFWLRKEIARERGITAYRAWVPFERIRPVHITQDAWESTYAWPPGDRPPYRPLTQSILRGVLIYAVLIAIVALALQYLTPFPVLTWAGHVL